MESHGMEKCLVFTSFQSAQEHMVQILEGCDIPVVAMGRRSCTDWSQFLIHTMSHGEGIVKLAFLRCSGPILPWQGKRY